MIAAIIFELCVIANKIIEAIVSRAPLKRRAAIIVIKAVVLLGIVGDTIPVRHNLVLDVNKRCDAFDDRDFFWCNFWHIVIVLGVESVEFSGAVVNIFFDYLIFCTV